MLVTREPAILYFGTPVVLIATCNEDGSPNLAPMSSAFWLGWRCVVGLAASSRTPQNMLRTRECVLNLPSVAQVAAVNRLALTTGSNPVPPAKIARGYRHEADKFGVAGLTPLARVAESLYRSPDVDRARAVGSRAPRKAAHSGRRGVKSSGSPRRA